MSSRRGLTQFDVLVVIGLLVLLIAIAVPVVNRTWEMANQTRCQSNIRTLSAGFFAFAKDHDGRLPGSMNASRTDRNPEHWDWLFGQYSLWEQPSHTVFERLALAPQNGTLWKYVNSSQAYLCPSLTYQNAGSGMGSNGRFDYAAFSCFGGARLTEINPVSELHFPLDPKNPRLVRDTQAPFYAHGLSSYMERRPTPMICQEDSRFSINSTLEGQHSGLDQIAHLHNGGSWYGAIDGGVYFVNEPDTDLSNIFSSGTNLWWQGGRKAGQMVSLDGDWGWGWWSRR